MTMLNEPTVGDWYRDTEDKIFEIVALDTDTNTIEIQYFDGAVEDIDIDDWYEMELESVAEPEDWSGPFDNVVRDDLGDTDFVRHPEDWSSPFDNLD